MHPYAAPHPFFFFFVRKVWEGRVIKCYRKRKSDCPAPLSVIEVIIERHSHRCKGKVSVSGMSVCVRGHMCLCFCTGMLVWNEEKGHLEREGLYISN